MGLIDSVNKVERALLTDKQEKAQERAEKKRKQAIKERDKLEKEVAKDLITQALTQEISTIYDLLGYNGASLYFKSLEAREKIINKVASNELEYLTACNLYDKILSGIDKRYKNNEIFIQAQKMEELKEEEEKAIKKHNFNEICKITAFCVYTGIIAVLKVIGFFLLFCLGFTKFIYAVQPQHKRRYR